MPFKILNNYFKPMLYHAFEFSRSYIFKGNWKHYLRKACFSYIVSTIHSYRLSFS